MSLKMIGLVGAFALAAPLSATAAPMDGMAAHATAPAVTSPDGAAAAVAPGDAKIDKVWWRGHGWRGYGWRGYGWHGYARPFFGYYYGRPYWHRRFWY